MNWSASTLRMLGMALGLGTTLMMSSCGGGIDVVSEGVQPVFAGSYDSSSTSVPCYWEGTQRFDLKGETGSVAAHAYSPSTSALNNIYTPGTWSDGTKTYACYWIGATRIDLEVKGVSGVLHTYATCITLSGSDRYVGGYYTTDGTTYIPCYWKNNTDGFQALGAVGSKAYVTGIGVDSQVFCSGYYLSGTDTVACYWDSPASPAPASPAPAPATPKVLNLPGGSTQAMAYGIVVANKVPWIVGHYTFEGKTIPCCWKGTKAYPDLLKLPTGAGNADVYAVTTKGSHASGYLYCAGYYHDGTKNVPIYWGINNIEDTTPDLDFYEPMAAPNNYDARAYALFSSGDDLWIGGNYLDTSSGSSVSVPCYWKGGERTNLTDGTSAARIACGPDVP